MLRYEDFGNVRGRILNSEYTPELEAADILTDLKSFVLEESKDGSKLVTRDSIYSEIKDVLILIRNNPLTTSYVQGIEDIIKVIQLADVPRELFEPLYERLAVDESLQISAQFLLEIAHQIRLKRHQNKNKSDETGRT